MLINKVQQHYDDYFSVNNEIQNYNVNQLFKLLLKIKLTNQAI